VERLWAPWRIGYITAVKPEGCVFCLSRESRDDAANYVVWRGPEAYVMLNSYPYNNGHLLIAPYQHTGELEQLPDSTLQELMFLARESVRLLRTEFGCEGVNLGANLGAAAGAGIADHLHLHAVPRWAGDSNFMASVAVTRVIPQSLESVWETMHPAFQRALGR